MSLVLIIVCFLKGNAQHENNLSSFNNYGKWGYSITPLLYNKASITRNFGNAILHNRSTPSFQIGVIRHFYRDKSWSFNTGVNLTLLPLYNLFFTLKNEDVFDDFGGEEFFKDYAYLYFSIPLNLEFKKQLSKTVYYNVSLGINIYYLTDSRQELIFTLHNQNNTEAREVFALFQETQNNKIQASAVISTGFYFMFNRFMLQTNIVYNKNFQNLWEGEYQFGNLLVSEPTRGNYTISGDFIGLSTTVYFKKRTRKNKRTKRKKK